MSAFLSGPPTKIYNQYSANDIFIYIYQILEEIRQRDIVYEVTAPVFNLQLVLNVQKPGSSQSSFRGSKQEAEKSAASYSSRLKGLDRTTDSAKKSVKFTDHDNEQGIYRGHGKLVIK